MRGSSPSVTPWHANPLSWLAQGVHANWKLQLTGALNADELTAKGTSVGRP